MGYHMTQRDTRFHLPRRHFKAALQALKALPETVCDRGMMASLSSLPKAFLALGWEVERHAKTGDINGIQFVGEKAHEDFVLFQALAPFVTKGCFIAMDGEDGTLWRWWFTGRKVVEQYGHVVYK